MLKKISWFGGFGVDWRRLDLSTIVTKILGKFGEFFPVTKQIAL